MADNILADILRYGKGMGQAGRAIAQPMFGDIQAGHTGLGSMMLGEGMNQNTARVQEIRDRYAYTPDTEEGRMYLEKLGQGIEKGVKLARKVPGVRSAEEWWEQFSASAPGVAAIGAGAAGVVDPTHGGGKAVKAVKGTSQAAEAARVAALRAVRDAEPLGPVFRSDVEQTIPTLPAKATRGQYIATLRNKPGIKGEELTDLGYNDPKTFDPSEVMTQESFLADVQSRRAPRETKRLSFENVTPEELTTKINDLTDSSIIAASSNVTSFPEKLRQYMPEGWVHPTEKITRENMRRSKAWDKFIRESPDVYAAAEADFLDSPYGNDQDLIRRWTDERNEPETNRDLENLVDQHINSRMQEVRNNPVMFENYFGAKGLEGKNFDQIHAEYGFKSNSGLMSDASLLEKEMRANPGIVKYFREQAEADLLRNPTGFNWGMETRGRIPQYPTVRYYGAVDQDSVPGYAEILEQQGSLPTSPDKRGYGEPHWTNIQPLPGKLPPLSRNDITMHLRVDDVQTPEGNPALLLNELQSKYAAGIGQAGTTRDPLTLMTHGELASDDVKRVDTMLREWGSDHQSGTDIYDDFGDTFTYENVDEIKRIADEEVPGSPEYDKAIADLLASHTATGPRNMPGIEGQRVITHRNRPFILDRDYVNQQPNLYDATPQGEAEAQQAIERFQRGEQNVENLPPRARIFSGNKDSQLFASDPRMMPRAGEKSWRLRGLKLALREAAERGATDLYYPTGQMIPRIEKWGDVDDARNDVLDDLADDNRSIDRNVVEQPTMDQVDEKLAREAGAGNAGDDADLPIEKIMVNYDKRLEKEWAKYLGRYGAKIEKAPMLPKSGEQQFKATANRIKITPELLTAILRGQPLYQVAGGAALLAALAAAKEGEQPQY